MNFNFSTHEIIMSPEYFISIAGGYPFKNYQLNMYQYIFVDDLDNVKAVWSAPNTKDVYYGRHLGIYNQVKSYVYK